MKTRNIKHTHTQTDTTPPALPPSPPPPCTGHSRIVIKPVNPKIRKKKKAFKGFLFFFLFSSSGKLGFFFFFIPKSINDVKALCVVIKALQQLSANSLQLSFGCSITRLPVYHQINPRKKMRIAQRRELVGKHHK